MTIQVIEVSLADLIVPPNVVKTDDSFVYEHLKRYCSNFRPLPAIAVTSDGSRLLVAGRYQYASIARELGDDRIRATLQGATFEELKKRGVPGLLSLVPKDILERELHDEIIPGYHIFFFKSVPDRQVVTQVDARFRSFLSQSLLDVLGDQAVLDISSSFDATARASRFDSRRQ